MYKRNTGRDDSANPSIGSGQSLRKRAEEIAARSPENIEALSPEETRRVLHELRTTQAKLDAARARYFDFYDQAPVSYVTLSEQGLILEANLAAATLLGVTRDVLVKQPIIRFIHEEYQYIYYLHRKQLFETGEPRACELWMVKKDKTAFWVCMVTTTAQDAAGAPVYRIVMSDITERKRAEEKLSYQANLLENVSDAIIATDLQYNIQFWNKAAEKQYGWTASEVIGHPLEMFIINDYQGSSLEVILQKISQDGYWKGEVTQNRRDGVRIPVLSTVSIVTNDANQTSGFIAVNRDITERKRAEEALREKDEFNFALFQHNPIETIVTDLEGRVVKCNIAKKKSGNRIPNIGDVMYRDYAGKHEKDMYKEMIECIREGKLKEFPELKYGDRFLSIKIAPFSKGAIITFQDITERKRAEEQIKISLIKYQVLFDSFPLGITISDKAGNIKESNKEAERLLGLTTDEHNKRQINGKEWSIIRTDGTPMPADEYASVMALKEKHIVENVEMGIVKGTGDITWINVTAAPIPLEDYGVAIAYGDITERKRAEEALRESEGKYHKLTDNAAEAIIVAQDGLLKFVNSKTLELTGYTERELTTRPFPDFIHPDDRDMVVGNYLRRIKGEAEQSRYEFRIIPCDGVVKWVEIGAVLIEWEGKPATLNFLTDITRRKQAEEALRKTEEKFRTVIENIFKFVPESLVVLTDKLNLFRRNKAFEDLVRHYAVKLNYSEEELTDMLIEQIKKKLVTGKKSEIRIPRKHT